MALTTASVVGGVASAAGSMGIGGGGGGGTPKWQKAAGKENYAYGKQVAGGMSVAPRNADQMQAAQQVRDSQGYLDGDAAQAQARARQLAGGVTADNIRSFYNPFEDDVVGSYLNDLDTMRQRQDVRVSGDAEQAKAFGGSREAVYRASIQGDLDATGARELSGIRSRGYDMASQNAMQSHGLSIAGNDQLAQMIAQRQRARFGETGALAASGMDQQTYDQYQRDLAQRQLQTRLQAAGQPQSAGYSQPGVNPFAAGVAGYQDGYGAVQDLAGLWKLPRNTGGITAPAG